VTALLRVSRCSPGLSGMRARRERLYEQLSAAAPRLESTLDRLMSKPWNLALARHLLGGLNENQINDAGRQRLTMELCYLKVCQQIGAAEQAALWDAPAPQQLELL